MEDYPENMIEFEKRFEGEQACLDHVVGQRWEGGVRCGHCGGEKLWPVRRGFECSACGRQASILSGTLFEGTHLPLAVWFRAIWWVVAQKNGASALGLQRQLGLSYKTAWSMLHKIRSAMVRPERTKLSGMVEVDEVCVGGVEEEAAGRQPGGKALVVIAAQEAGRVRMKVIPGASAQELLPFIAANIELASTVHTDAWRGYAQLGKRGYGHKGSSRKRARSPCRGCIWSPRC